VTGIPLSRIVRGVECGIQKPYRIAIAGALVLVSSLGCSISPGFLLPRSASQQILATEAIDRALPFDPFTYQKSDQKNVAPATTLSNSIPVSAKDRVPRYPTFKPK
jgi:hypothetical protein